MKAKARHITPEEKKIATLLEYGMRLHNQGQLPQAESTYKKILQIDKNNADANHLLGVICIQSQAFANAIHFITKSIEQKPKNSLPYYNLGLAYQNMSAYKKAAECYEKAIKFNPEHIEAILNAGNMYMYLQDRYSAEKKFRRAIHLNPNRLDANNNLGLCLFEQHRNKDARKYYQMAIKLNPNNPEGHNNLASLEQSEGNILEAIDAYRKSISLHPTYYTAINNLAFTHERNLEIDKAKELYKKTAASPAHTVISNTTLATYCWIDNDIAACEKYLETTIDYSTKPYSPKQNKFIVGYSQFLLALIENYKLAPAPYLETDAALAPISIAGDSHSLTYANLTIQIENELYRGAPKLMTGCKAWHLANEAENEYKFQFKKLITKQAENSTLLVSLGEIDCRSDEGILVAFKKSAKNKNLSINFKDSKTLAALTNQVRDLTEQYCKYISEACATKNIQAYLFNVPAPLKANLDEQALYELQVLIASYNQCLSESATGFKNISIIDLYSVTNDLNGFSSGEYHIDQVHLSPAICEKIFGR
ncbi:tetratricopeptide repeat protein [Saccharophagus degradans]|uniref:Tetratricopeptide repeat protein n=1 Tax=Saccharophagus degradans TaxID=86304 RepID=A0AAW7X320_9GAMM|nr:tetratricopeptide repeat protein [Saccharophagus degradans]MDO6420988.1 tetratricopeptide repeat protein [Saccharophagus degradans]MDO6606101.1 tetratricopeptide repeat protein [Saccharophagus degradans]